MIEALHVMAEEETVILSLKDEMSPGLLQTEENDQFSYIIMPMKIN